MEDNRRENNNNTGNIGMGVETIYEIGSKINHQQNANQHQTSLESPSSHVVSERVQNLASQIYDELKRIINRCSDDEEVVSGLMPLVVNVLESLDLAIIENQQLQVELELCKDDNDQLVNAFDKEKANKKKVEQKLFEYEFHFEEEKQKFQQKIDSLESIVKILELKSKNASDHASRLEEKESEVKSEYNKLHSRYTELLRGHCDLMERVKILMGSEDGMSISGPISISNINLKPFQLRKTDYDSFQTQIENNENNNNDNAINKNDITTSSSTTSPLMPKQAWADQDLSLEDASIIEDVDEIPRDREREKDRDTQSITGPNINSNDYTSSVTDNFFVGMEKEVENLIMENNELLATKNALNIVKDDLIAKVDELLSELTMSKDEVQQLTVVKDKLKSRISTLEDELKKTKETLEEAEQKIAHLAEDDEEGVPIAHRKRFTRVEMARVLMERNQYKERLIELQDAIRWTELIRQTKNESDKKSPIWKFFSNLFSSSSTKDSSRFSSVGSPAIRYSTTNPTTVTPALDAMRKRARQQQGGVNDLVLLMDSDLTSERARALKNVRAHVHKANGDRIQAYGWSINNSVNSEDGDQKVETANDKKFKTVSVPVPIYCRPLTGDDIGMKIWCASAVDLSGGEAGFPCNDEKPEKSPTSVEEAKEVSVDSAIADLETELNQAIAEQCGPANETKLSTFVWICSVSHSKSKVTIVNIRSNPSEILDSFIVKTHLLCIASVPGAKPSDLQGTDNVNLKSNEIKRVKVETPKKEVISTTKFTAKDNELVSEAKEIQESTEDDSVTPSNETVEKLTEYVAYTEPPSPSKEEPISPISGLYQPMSTCLPTMWLGGQNSMLYVHSSIAQWSQCIASVKLPDSILQIIHFRGRVFVALANGQCCIFLRSLTTGEWDFTNYLIVDVGQFAIQQQTNTANISTPTSSPSSTQNALYSIRCMEISKSSIWLGYRNLIFILDPSSLRIAHSFAVHPRKETQVRQLTGMGDGVWCSLRLDSTIRLYSSLKPYQHLQDVDIEPYVSKMLNPRAFSFIRVTALKASNSRLWIGTANGVILSIPCEKADNVDASLSSNETGKIAMKTFVPKCNPNSAQLSFHGHKDAVKFFTCTRNLILSGGEGYVDFRLNPDDELSSISKGDRSHLIVWEISV